MIEKIKCEQQDAKNNLYQIQEIFLFKQEECFCIGFHCETEEKANLLFSGIDRLRMYLKEKAVSGKIGFSFATGISLEGELAKHSVILKGNILEAVNALIYDKILVGKNRMILQDEDEEAIQNFLRESAKPSQAKDSQKSDSPGSKLNSKGCSLF